MFSATVIHSMRPRSWWMKAIGRFAQDPADIAAAEVNLALVERVDARKDLDESGFTGTILTEQRDDLTGIDRHAHIAQRPGATERLRDVAHGQEVIAPVGPRGPVG